MTSTEPSSQLIAIVTGAARGIGLATTKLFLAKGYRVAMVDRDAPELKNASQGLAHVLPVNCDVSEEDQVNAMMHTVLQWSNRVDVLVNNAGVADFGPIQETTFARWQAVMRTNLDGVFLCSQAALPALRVSRGCIVNIASISGVRASTLRVAYGTSKAAVIHLTKQQAAELGEWGIRVNCVAPGPVKTKLATAVHTPDIVSAYHDAIPLNRYGSEEEIAQVIVFLASAEASYVTGQMLAVDGGFDATGVGLAALRIPVGDAMASLNRDELSNLELPTF
jgi:NAD(P)-dependent dehydrogenase (short-subunit alcohol dehydrogenase family)